MTTTLRSVLFVSGATESALESALASGADAVVADWEDLVPAPLKADARLVTTRVFAAAAAASTSRRMVRVNHPTDAREFQADLLALGDVRIDGVVIPKADMAALETLADLGLPLFPIVEDARGVRGAYELAAHEATEAVLVGLADLAASLGVPPHPDSLVYVRSRILVDVKAAGRPVIDVPFSGTSDAGEQARASRSLGFDGKICRRAEHVAACAVFDEVRATAVEG